MRIERDTRTEKKILKQDQTGDIVIVGSNVSNVKTAKRRKYNCYVSRMKQKSTHFVSIPMNSSEIMRNFEKFKALKRDCIFLKKLHIKSKLRVSGDGYSQYILEWPERAPCNFVEHQIGNPFKIKMQNPIKLNEDLSELQEQVIENFRKSNVSNVNVPEKIIICLDVCYDEQSSMYRLGDGTTFTPINMMKRVLDFFLYSKHAINKRTEFALLILKEDEPLWLHDFTSNVKDIINAIDYFRSEGCKCEKIDFTKVFELLKQNIIMPDFKKEECMQTPPYVVRMLVLYGRPNCVPMIPQDDAYFNFLKKHVYFYIDILLAHEEDCALYKCEEIYDALQLLDNGYSYVFEVSKNATKTHDCIAKLLAHPLQRPLQKNTNYSFGSHYQ